MRLCSFPFRKSPLKEERKLLSFSLLFPAQGAEAAMAGEWVQFFPLFMAVFWEVYSFRGQGRGEKKIHEKGTNWAKLFYSMM